MTEAIYTALPPQPQRLKAIENQVPIIIQTSCPAVVEWLRRQGIEGKVLYRATPADVEGCWLIASTAPIWVIAAATLVSYVKFVPGRIDERSADDLERLGAELVTGKFIEI